MAFTELCYQIKLGFLPKLRPALNSLRKDEDDNNNNSNNNNNNNNRMTIFTRLFQIGRLRYLSIFASFLFNLGIGSCWFMLSVRMYRVMDARGKSGEHERSVKPRLNDQTFSSNIVLDEAAKRSNIVRHTKCWMKMFELVQTYKMLDENV